MKELHFFDDYFRLIKYGDQSRYFAREPYARARWRRYFLSECKAAIRFPSLSRGLWTARFLFSRRDFDWYIKLFPTSEGIVCGEVTPAYAVLDHDEVHQIHRHFPWLKVILLLRNPIDRAWSHAKMELASRRGRQVKDLDLCELINFFKERSVQRRGAYSETIRIWSGVFGPRQLDIRLYDEIQNSPRALITDLCRFLEIEESLIPTDIDLEEVVFRGPDAEMPSAVKIWLRKEYFTEISSLASYLDRRHLLTDWL